MRLIAAVSLAASMVTAGDVGSWVQPVRLRFAIEGVGSDAAGAAFVHALREGVRASENATLAEDRQRVEVDVVVVSTPIRCEGQAISAIAIGAHRLGRARSTQWVNVVVSDEPRANEYARRVLTDLTAALTEPR